MWGEHEGMGWWMLFGSLWFFLFSGFVVWLFVRATDRTRQSARHEESALEMLKRRYASGEITKEQFDAIRRDII